MDTSTGKTLAILAAVTVLSLGIKHPLPSAGQLTEELTEEDLFQMSTDQSVGENPFDMSESPAEEATPPSPPALEPDVKEEKEEEDSAPPPTFYRSGEMIKTGEKSAPPPPPAEQNVFEEPEPVAPEETLPDAGENTSEEASTEETGAQESGETPAEEENAEQTETANKSAPKSSLVMRLMDRLKYLIAAVGLGVGGCVYLLGKKKIAPAKAISQPQETAAVQPGSPGPQAVEETSKRLEHALSAMTETPAAPAEQTPPAEGAKQ